jgi:hypothetical protein
MKEPVDSLEQILSSPHTGTWHLGEDGELTFAQITNDWHDITGEDEAFFLRVYQAGDYRFRGADLGILVTKGRMQTAEGLTPRCLRYIDGIRAQYRSIPVADAPAFTPFPPVK